MMDRDKYDVLFYAVAIALLVFASGGIKCGVTIKSERTEARK